MGATVEEGEEEEKWENVGGNAWVLARRDQEGSRNENGPGPAPFGRMWVGELKRNHQGKRGSGIRNEVNIEILR